MVCSNLLMRRKTNPVFMIKLALVKHSEKKRVNKHIVDNGALFLREGRRHSIYQKGKLKTECPDTEKS